MRYVFVGFVAVRSKAITFAAPEPWLVSAEARFDDPVVAVVPPDPQPCAARATTVPRTAGNM
jgi:hypothetical protein